MANNSRTIKVTSKRQITLPKELCDQIGIKNGQQIRIKRVNNELRLTPLPDFPYLSKEHSLFQWIGLIDDSTVTPARDHDQIVAGEARGED